MSFWKIERLCLLDKITNDFINNLQVIALMEFISSP